MSNQPVAINRQEEKMSEFKFANVTRTYNGATGCACGCGGDYFRVKDDPAHAKKIKHFLKKLASGKYEVREQDGCAGEYIYEIELSKSGHDRVACFYVKPMVDNAS